MKRIRFGDASAYFAVTSANGISGKTDLNAILPRALVARLGVVVLCITIIFPPIGYAAVSISQLKQRALEQALAGARHVEVQLQLGNSSAFDLLEKVSTAVLYATHNANKAVTANWVTGSNGLLIAFDGELTMWPELEASAPIKTAGFAGRFNVTVSSREIFSETFWVALIFLAFGLAANFCFRRLPLAALDRAIGMLDAKQQELSSHQVHIERQNLHFHAALDNMAQGLCMWDAGNKLIICNDRFRQMYKLPRDLVRPGTALEDVIEARKQNGTFAVAALDGGDPVISVPVVSPVCKFQQLHDGRTISLSITPMPNGGFVATHQDVTEQRQREEHIAYLARHDALTQLPNRIMFNEKLQAALKGLRRGANVTLLYLDLDRFKAVNDALGHHKGDALLKTVAQRITQTLRTGDICARLGGDEFAIIQTGGNQPGDATATANRLIQLLGAPYDLDGQNATIGASIGIAVAQGLDCDEETLQLQADIALYRAKESGKSTFLFFEPDMGDKILEQRLLEQDLRLGLEKSEFQLHYQPIQKLSDGSICGFEALVRWFSKDRGPVPPSLFIPVAEDCGFIDALGEWVIREACKEAAEWNEKISIAVNVSARQLKSGKLPAIVVSALAASSLDPERLQLEVTESVFIEDSERALSVLRQLRSLGVRIALDDFGTGYSSLSYLRQYAFDKIKLDRSFVGGASRGDEAIAIVRAVSDIGSSLKIVTTAEGVETVEQLEMVRAQGYVEAQGFLFSAAVPASEARRMIERKAVSHEAVASKEKKPRRKPRQAA